MERVDKAILEQLLASLDAQAILCLLSASNPLVALNGKCLTLSSFVVRGWCRPISNTCGVIVLAVLLE